MKKNIIFAIVIIVLGALVGIPYYLLFKLNADLHNAFGAIQKTQEEVQKGFDVTATSSPFVQLFQATIQANSQLLKASQGTTQITPEATPEIKK